MQSQRVARNLQARTIKTRLGERLSKKGSSNSRRPPTNTYAATPIGIRTQIASVGQERITSAVCAISGQTVSNLRVEAPVRSVTVALPPVTSIADTRRLVTREKQRKTMCAVFPQRTRMTSRKVCALGAFSLILAEFIEKRKICTVAPALWIER